MEGTEGRRRARRRQRRSRVGAGDERGAAAVEFAFVALPMLMLVFAIIAYGFMLSFRQALSQAAAEGARAAAVSPPGVPDLPATAGGDSRRTRAIAAVNQGLGSYGVTCTSGGSLMKGTQSAGTCAISAPQGCVGSTVGSQCVKVTLAYTYANDPLVPAFPGLGVLLPSTLTYSTEVEVT